MVTSSRLLSNIYKEMAATAAQGVYFDCGFDQPIGVNITCTGQSCPALDTFPKLVCTTDSLTTNCNNQVTSCPNNAQPNVRSVFSITQKDDGSLDCTQNLTIDGNDYSGSDLNGRVLYGPNPSPTTTTVTTSSRPTPPTVSTTTKIVTASSANRLSIPRLPNARMFFVLIVILSLFVSHILAYSVPRLAQIGNVFITGTVMIYPLIWSHLSVGVQGQCTIYGSYLNVSPSQSHSLTLIGPYSCICR